MSAGSEFFFLYFWPVFDWFLVLNYFLCVFVAILTMPTCSLCSRPFKTRGSLARHRHRQLFHDGKRMEDSVPPVCVSLPYFVNLVQQPLKCPLCPFVRERCKNVKSVAAHFRKSHPYHQLCVSYHCQWCDFHMFVHMLYTDVPAYHSPPLLPRSTQMMAPSRL